MSDEHCIFVQSTSAVHPREVFQDALLRVKPAGIQLDDSKGFAEKQMASARKEWVEQVQRVRALLSQPCHWPLSPTILLLSIHLFVIIATCLSGYARCGFVNDYRSMAVLAISIESMAEAL